MKSKIFIFLFSVLFLSSAVADDAVTLTEVEINGRKIKIGQSSDIIRNRVAADQYVPSGDGSGNMKGYYEDNGKKYIVTFGATLGRKPKYIVKQIEQVGGSMQQGMGNSVAEGVLSSIKLTRNQFVEAQRDFKIQVMSFDVKSERQIGEPSFDYVRIRITNESIYTIPAITVVTKRFDGKGRLVGWSRKPEIPVNDLRPGFSKEVDYYPIGHLSRVEKLTVEIESLAAPEDEQLNLE